MHRDLPSGRARPPRSRTLSRALGGLALGVAVAGWVAAAVLASPPHPRTVLIRNAAKGRPNGPSSAPEISADGRFVAFASRATNLGPLDPNGHISDVYLYDRASGIIGLISAGPHGQGASGPSTQPALAEGAKVVVFVSTARNLVPGDTNPHSDVFAWIAGVGIVRVSVSSTGAQANGDSGEPDVSYDGRLVTFSSTASNLAAGSTGGHRNIYVRDLLSAKTYLVSALPANAAPNGDSSAPAISPDGASVSFFSSASNLVPGDLNRKPDVFVRSLSTGATQLASISSAGQQQNRAVTAPFAQLSDVSNGGRFVVFDSDATNLVRGDSNRHTDVFVRDTVAKITRRVSLATTDQQSDNDSFAPRISADGRFVTFDSFARDLTPFIPAGPNVFVRDLLRNTTVMADVSAVGRARSPEHQAQLLQRPSISDDGSLVAFVSSADNLSGNRAGLQNAFVRALLPAPVTKASHRVLFLKGHAVIAFFSHDPQAGPLLCRLDHQPVALCPLGVTVLPALRPGPHVLLAFPGGPGTAYAGQPIVVRILIRRLGRGRHSRITAKATVTNPSATAAAAAF